MNIGIVGLGMIGGSIAKSLARRKKRYRVTALDADRETLRQALYDKVISAAAEDISELSECDLVFCAVPAASTADICLRLCDVCKGVVTDVASVKGRIVSRLEGRRFVGGHPMAGVERGGYSASKAHMFENAYYILCGDRKSEDCKIVDAAVRDMHAIPVYMNADTHDREVARISHVPHMIAYSMVNSSLVSWEAKMLAAGGFKDITRIASSSPELWTEIVSLNRDNVANGIDAFIEQLKLLKTMLVSGKDAQMTAYMSRAKELRDGLVSSSGGVISKAFELCVDVEDKVGMIGTITGLLAKDRISIANIVVENSREGEPGVLRLTFFDRDARLRAETVLKEEGIACLGI